MAKATYKSITKYEQHIANPFTPETVETMRVKKRTTMVHATKRQAIHQIEVVDKATGEVSDVHTTFLSVKPVDEDQFVKVFVRELRALWDLSKPAMRVLTYIMACMKVNQDEIIFEIEDCMGYTRYKSERSVFSGLAELIENGIIARSTKTYRYYINPMIIFNGNRVTFAHTYIKQRRSNSDKKTIDMFDDNPELEAPEDEQQPSKADTAE